MKKYIYSSLFILLICVTSSCSSSDDSSPTNSDLTGTWLMTGNIINNGRGTFEINSTIVTTVATFDFEENGNVYTVTLNENGTITESGGIRGSLKFAPLDGSAPTVYNNYSISTDNAGYELFDGTFSAMSNELSITRSDAQFVADYSLNGNTLTITTDLSTVQNEIFQDYDLLVTGTNVMTFEKQ